MQTQSPHLWLLERSSNRAFQEERPIWVIAVDGSVFMRSHGQAVHEKSRRSGMCGLSQLRQGPGVVPDSVTLSFARA
jgi:hypothetical protein